MSLMDTYCDETVQFVRRPKTEWGELGDPVSTPVRARVVWKNKLVRDFDGNEAMSTGKMIVSSLPRFGEFQDGFNWADRIQISGKEFAPIGLKEVKGFGVSHYEVYLK